MLVEADHCLYQVNRSGLYHGHHLRFSQADDVVIFYGYYDNGLELISFKLQPDDEINVDQVFDTGAVDILLRQRHAIYLINGRFHGPQYCFDDYGHLIEYACYNYGKVIPESLYRVDRDGDEERIYHQNRLTCKRYFNHNVLVSEHFVLKKENIFYHKDRITIIRPRDSRTVHEVFVKGELVKTTEFYNQDKHGLVETPTKTINYRFGARDGEALYFNTNGTLRERRWYCRGRWVFTTVYEPTQTIHYNMEAGQRHGVALVHHMDGTTTQERWVYGLKEV